MADPGVDRAACCFGCRRPTGQVQPAGRVFLVRGPDLWLCRDCACDPVALRQFLAAFRATAGECGSGRAAGEGGEPW